MIHLFLVLILLLSVRFFKKLEDELSISFQGQNIFLDARRILLKSIFRIFRLYGQKIVGKHFGDHCFIRGMFRSLAIHDCKFYVKQIHSNFMPVEMYTFLLFLISSCSSENSLRRKSSSYCHIHNWGRI